MDKEEAKKKIAADAEARTKAREGKTAEGSKPTPTQEENDLAALGASTFPLEQDGSPPEGEQPGTENEPHKRRHMEAGGSGAGYQTRQSEPKQSEQPRRTSQHQPPSSSHSSS